MVSTGVPEGGRGLDKSRWKVPGKQDEDDAEAREWFDRTFLHYEACLRGVGTPYLRIVSYVDGTNQVAPSGEPALSYLKGSSWEKGSAGSLEGPSLDKIVARLKKHPGYPTKGAEMRAFRFYRLKMRCQRHFEKRFRSRGGSLGALGLCLVVWRVNLAVVAPELYGLIGHLERL